MLPQSQPAGGIVREMGYFAAMNGLEELITVILGLARWAAIAGAAVAISMKTEDFLTGRHEAKVEEWRKANDRYLEQEQALMEKDDMEALALLLEERPERPQINELLVGGTSLATAFISVVLIIQGPDVIL